MANSKRLASLSQPPTNPFNLVGAETPLPPSPDRDLGRRLRRNQGALLGLFIVTIMGLLALCAPVLAGHDPAQQYSGRKLEGPSVEFPLGTDQLSRDLFSRLVYGARPSIGLAALATVLICLVGVSVGVVSGYVGGWLDDLLMRLVDVFLALPGLLLALAIIGILGPGLENVILGVILVSWAGYARLVRGLVLAVRERLFVQAAVAIGAGTGQIIWRHVLPNIIAPVIVLASLEMGVIILTIAGLNFLGLGIQPPTAEWGAMLNQGRPFFQRAPQLMIYPGLMITLTVLGFNLLGDGLRDVLDPQHVQ